MNFTKLLNSIFLSLICLIAIVLLKPYEGVALEQHAIFAGGCFWCLEHDFQELKGVLSVESGYTGGKIPNPSYRQVSSENTGHKEAIKVTFDPLRVSYQELLLSYWRNIDPLDGNGQFCDRGDSYKPFIFTNDLDQKNEAIKSIEFASKEIDEPIDRIKVVVEDASDFWVAEDYHQDFAEYNSLKYNFYRFSCGRDARLDQVWGEQSRTNKPWKGLAED